MLMNRLLSLCVRLGSMSDEARRKRPPGANPFFSTAVDWEYGKRPQISSHTAVSDTQRADIDGGRLAVAAKGTLRCN